MIILDVLLLSNRFFPISFIIYFILHPEFFILLTHHLHSLLTNLTLSRSFQVRTALDFVTKAQSERPIITFCEALDSVLGGGVFIGQIVSTVCDVV
jgi:hypothetical protein